MPSERSDQLSEPPSPGVSPQLPPASSWTVGEGVTGTCHSNEAITMASLPTAYTALPLSHRLGTGDTAGP